MGKKKGRGKGLPKTIARYSQPRRPSSPHGASRVQAAISAVSQHYSLRDEARYMSNHRSAAFDSSKRLRHMPVAFVSAGCLEGTVQDKELRAEKEAAPPVTVDTQALAQMTIRSPSPAPSAVSSSGASSHELIVFRGRLHTPSLPREVGSTSKRSLALRAVAIETRPRPVTTEAAATLDSRGLTGAESVADTADMAMETVVSSDAPATQALASSHAVPPQINSDVESDTNSVIDSHFEKRRSGRERWDTHITPWVSKSKPGIGWLPVNDRPNMDEFSRGTADPYAAAPADDWMYPNGNSRDAALDDYAQNAEIFNPTGDMKGFSAVRELDLETGSHNDWESDKEPDIPPHLEPDENDGWTSDMLRDLDGHSTSTDVEYTIARIRRRRMRGTVVQYLVQYEGYADGDFRWLPITAMTRPSDKLLVESFETGHLARNQLRASSLGCDGSSDIDEDSSESEEMDDEQYARALQMEEELGIEEDDLVSHGADYHFVNPANAVSQGFRSKFDRPNKKRQQHRGRPKDPVFPSASELAKALDMDPYAGFDIMDTERPSLRMKNKGRRGQKPPELDDSDLNARMKATWEADRSKKRLKKAEREQDRQQGLLGRKGKGPDLNVKYKEGFSMENVIEEIREFWAATGTEKLSLPSMESHRRQFIHQFVNEFGIGSKSQGDGLHRHTILSKNSRTLAFDDEFFDNILQAKYVRRLHGVSKYGSQKKSGKAPKGNGSKSRPMVSYKDGEVVGAKAPELGVENKGRAMLEKMGWSKGMALGAVDNKGILQPIAHTVKTTKAGLR